MYLDVENNKMANKEEENDISDMKSEGLQQVK